MVTCVLLLALLREPLFFLEPRIWAEEGTVHITSIFSSGIWTSLITPHLGYYSLFNNYVTAIGLGLFGLSGVAYVTTLFSLAIILMTVFAPMVLESKYWDTSAQKGVLIFFILLIGSSEIWLNTVNSQFYFCAFNSLLILSNTNHLRSWKMYCALFMFFNGALTGITTIALAPFFIFKYLKLKNRSWLEHVLLAILILGIAVQFTAFFYLKMSHELSRLDIANLVNLPAGFFANITSVLPFPGRVIKIVFLVLLGYLLLAINKNSRDRLSPLIIATYLALLFALLSLKMLGGDRYGFAPAVLIFVFLVNASFSDNLYKKYIKILIVAFLTIMIYGATISFFDTKIAYDPGWEKFSTKNIKKISDDSYSLKIFPQHWDSIWEINLSKKDLEKFK